MLAAAGMECEVHAPASFELAPETEALLAWTVREGATNAVRHSGARAVRDPAQVAAAVRAALGIHELPPVGGADTLAHVLARRQLLLVLDNWST